MEVSVTDMLKARDDRVLKQKELQNKYDSCLICFTMNIAGPEKINPLIEEGFKIGTEKIFAQLEGESVKILHYESEKIFTGCTAYFAVQYPPEPLKQLMVEIEDECGVGRLFDIDVLSKDGRKISRTELNMKPRKCLICNIDAMICSSSRAHSVDKLTEKTRSILLQSVTEYKADIIASTAIKSLSYEVCTTPKPGLVDCLDSGSHSDMDIFTFTDSISVLYPYFKECALCGAQTALKKPEETFRLLRYKGKIAQKRMFNATKGINTHKGAIFSLGIICAACGRLMFSEYNADSVLKEAAKMSHGVSKELSLGNETAGKRIFKEHGIKGIRGQSEEGFPAVRNFGFPTLLKGVKNGLSLNDAGLGALLSIICNTDDTNMIKRSSLEDAKLTIGKIKEITEKTPFPDRDTMLKLNREFTEKGISPGGSADLLSICYFLFFYTV